MCRVSNGAKLGQDARHTAEGLPIHFLPRLSAQQRKSSKDKESRSEHLAEVVGAGPTTRRGAGSPGLAQASGRDAVKVPHSIGHI